MPVVPADDEIPLYVNDYGKVSCHITGCDWDPSQSGIGRRTNLRDLCDTIRDHAVLDHMNELGR